MNTIIYGDNLYVLLKMPKEVIDLIYIDPPFNTGKTQKRGEIWYDDSRQYYLRWLVDRLAEMYNVLKPSGSLFVHLDYREVHRIKIELDDIFGRSSFINEIIWAYDYGGRSKSKWSAKHDNILWYAKNPDSYCFNYDEIDRIPYMAPSLVGPEKAAKGKTLTDTWWNTIVPTNGKEKTGYPTQKPIKIIERIVKVHSRPGELVADFFSGSGTTLEAAAKNNRQFLGVDDNVDAISTMKKRLEFANPTFISEKDFSWTSE